MRSTGCRLAAWVILFACSACTHAPQAPAVAPAALAQALEDLVDQTAASSAPDAVVLLHVQAPRWHLNWSGAAGGTVDATTTTGDTGPTLRIASNTKTFVAAAVLRLVEDGRLDLDAPVEAHLKSATVDALHAAGYDVPAISARMLLQHTSGLRDFATQQVYFDRIAAQPSHRWTRGEQLALALRDGPPLSAPGAAFHYSDTGYILLGELLEQIAGPSMAQTVRLLLDYRRLGLAHTWFETLEPVPAGAPGRAVQWFDGVDAASFDASIDLYGGGGLVSTLADLGRFYRALVRGVVFGRPQTAQAMLVMSPQSIAAGGTAYGMGISRLDHAGVACYGHGGFWGTDAWHCPTIDLTVAAAVTHTASRANLRAMTLEALRLVVLADPTGIELARRKGID